MTRMQSLAGGLAAVCALAAAPALAQSAGEWTLGIGGGYVVPQDGNGELVDGTLDLDVGDNLRPTITAEYFILDNVGIELLAAWPFEHSVMLDGLGKVGKINHLPPTLSMQYHFPTTSRYKPFVGAGINYTTFFNEDSEGALDGSDLSLDDSWGLALHLGLDYEISPRSAFRTDIRWIDIDSDVKLDGEDIGEAEIDPWVIGASYVLKF